MVDRKWIQAERGDYMIRQERIFTGPARPRPGGQPGQPGVRPRDGGDGRRRRPDDRGGPLQSVIDPQARQGDVQRLSRGVRQRLAPDGQGSALQEALPDAGGVAETEADHVDDAEKQWPMVDAVREVPRLESGDLPLPARRVQKRRVLRQFAPPAARHGGNRGEVIQVCQTRLRCLSRSGIRAHGFLRLRYAECTHETLVASF